MKEKKNIAGNMRKILIRKMTSIEMNEHEKELNEYDNKMNTGTNMRMRIKRI